MYYKVKFPISALDIFQVHLKFISRKKNPENYRLAMKNLYKRKKVYLH